MPRKSEGSSDTNTCSVDGCSGEAHKSLSRKKVADALTDALSTEGRKVYLCKDHYKSFKKATKKERKFERMDW